MRYSLARNCISIFLPAYSVAFSMHESSHDVDDMKDGNTIHHVLESSSGAGKQIVSVNLSHENDFSGVGRWADAEANEQRKVVYPDGSSYEGGWKDGKRNGKGTYTNAGRATRGTGKTV